LLGGPGFRSTEPNVVVDRVGRDLGGDGDDNEDPAGLILDDVVGEEFAVRDAGKLKSAPPSLSTTSM
jgi:hypothetical protein